MRCPECGSEVSVEEARCPFCGAELPAESLEDPAAAGTSDAVDSQPDTSLAYAGDVAQASAPVSGEPLEDAPSPQGEDPDATIAAVPLVGELDSSDQEVHSEPIPLMEPTQAGPAVPDAAESLFNGADSPVFQSPKPAYEVRHQERPPRATVAGKILVTLVVLIVLVGATGFGISFLVHQGKQDAMARNVSIPISVSADGLSASGGTKTPVKIEGTSAAGAKLDKVVYVTGESSDFTVPQGRFTFSIPASPIAKDGTIYDISKASIETTVEAGGPTTPVAFRLQPIAALDVTEDQVSAAYAYADDGGADSGDIAYSLKEAALKRHRDAVSRQQADEAAQKKAAEDEAKRHVVAASFEFYLPEEWVDRVTVTVNGDTVTVAPNAYPDAPLLTLTVADAQPDPYSDEDYSFWFQGPDLADGKIVWGYAINWGFQIASYNVNGSTDPDHYYDYDEAEELVRLQSGGGLTYDQVLQQMENGGYSDQVAEVTHAFIRDDVAASIKPRS